jgi:hypothetical protein
VVMLDTERAFARAKVSDRYPAGFGDGHAKVIAMQRATPPGMNVFSGTSRACFDTRLGAKGFDWQ